MIYTTEPIKKPIIHSEVAVNGKSCEECNFLRTELHTRFDKHQQDNLGIVGYCPVREKWSFVNRSCKAWQERNK